MQEDKILQATPPLLMGEVGCTATRHRKDKHKKSTAKNSVPGTISNGCQATAAVTKFAAIPPPLSHHSKQQHSYRQPTAASASATKARSTSTSAGNSNSFCFCCFQFWDQPRILLVVCYCCCALSERHQRAGALRSGHARCPTLRP